MLKKFFTAAIILGMVFTAAGCQNAAPNEANRYTASVEADSFYIQAQDAGSIVDIPIAQGNHIKSGDKAAEVDTKQYELQKNQAEGALLAAKAKQSELPDNAKSTLKDEASGAVEQAQAAVDLAQLQIDRALVTSQGDGVISDVYVNKGELVSPGMNIAKVINLNSQYIKIYVEESKRNKVKLGQSVLIYVDNDKLNIGKVVYISPESEFTPKNVETKSEKESTVFEVKISLDKNDRTTPGMLVDAEID